MIKKVFRFLFRPSIVTFISGAIISTVAQLVIQMSIADSIALLLGLLATFMVYSIGTSERIAWSTKDAVAENHASTSKSVALIQSDVSAQLRLLELTATWEPNLDAFRDVGYDVSLRRVKEAQKSIYIISDYSPKDDPIEHGPERQEYLAAISSVVLDHINRGKPFEYKRILQCNVLTESLTRGTMSRGDMEGDPQTFDHCREMIREAQPLPAGTVRLYVRKPIPSMPSVLIVDGKYILFTIPRNAPRPTPARPDNWDLINMGALSLHDNTEQSKVVSEFLRMFGTFAEESIQIHSIEDSAL